MVDRFGGKKFIYSFDKELTILSYFKKMKIKNLFEEVLFPLNYHISHKNFSDVFNNKNYFHKVKSENLKNHFSDILSKANDNDVYQLGLGKQKRLLGIIINYVFHIIGLDSEHII
ncbi:hypothetical protein HGD80_01795 [Paulownia witches'-broom phytoplasma]|uniref:Uncharacterized protein n=1 Tax=Paulownia witches'-broom phytoplasma TaxID=39647 RepID=A0ABX8TPP7_9MOLU|nr:hypothetical protein [Paulownia witches'-broom phytoplasma]QYC31294.1 hypothetical protein HGD80_01795 [Paulownia witches'-broom phytoplasma]